MRSGIVRERLTPLSALIVDTLPGRYVVPAFLLAYTRARWSEVQAGWIKDIQEGRSLIIKASKNKSTRSVPPLPERSAQYWRVALPTAPVTIVSYDQLCDQLRRTSRDVGITLPQTANDGTHIFRHLYASFKHAEGMPKHEISHALGHHSQTAVRHYIHPLESLTTLSNNP